MAKIKLQIYRGEEPGKTVGPSDVDFRGEGWHGAGTDEHRTVVEFETEDESVITAFLSFAPQANALFDELAKSTPSYADHIASALGLKGSGVPHLGWRIYDNDK